MTRGRMSFFAVSGLGNSLSDFCFPRTEWFAIHSVGTKSPNPYRSAAFCVDARLEGIMHSNWPLRWMKIGQLRNLAKVVFEETQKIARVTLEG